MDGGERYFHNPALPSLLDNLALNMQDLLLANEVLPTPMETRQTDLAVGIHSASLFYKSRGGRGPRNVFSLPRRKQLEVITCMCKKQNPYI